MSIYVEKRKGRPTGCWIVEVVIDKQRHHARTRSHEDALRIERELHLRGKMPPVLRGSLGYTLRHLDRDAGHKLWANNTREEDDVRRWRMCATLLGWDTPVSEVRHQALEILVDKLRAYRKPPFDNKTINHYVCTVSKALRWAHKNEIILSLPAIPRQKEGVGRISHMRPSEIPRFLEWIQDNERKDVAVCLHVLTVTGMRLGELLSLAPDQVELDDWTDSGGYYLNLEGEQVKTGNGRYVPLPAELAEPLIEVLSTKVPDEDLLRRACHRASLALKLHDIVTPHVLRHTAATTLTAKGVPSLVVADLLGHKSLTTTRKYTHPSRETLRKAMEVLKGAGSHGKVHGTLPKNHPSGYRQNPWNTTKTTIYETVYDSLQSAPFAARDIPPEGEDP
jgi:integrase